MKTMRTILIGLLVAMVAAFVNGCTKKPMEVSDGSLEISAPKEVRVFRKWEGTIRFLDDLESFAEMGGVQANDAYDADRDGRFLRVVGVFTHDSGTVMRVPTFAMKSSVDGPWTHKIRWSPQREGRWHVVIQFDGNTGEGRVTRAFDVGVVEASRPKLAKGGPIVAPNSTQNPRYLRERRADGTSEAVWTFGTCRSWTVRLADESGVWGDDELLDRKTELLDPMRRGGFNLLNQWMAPWEYLLVHHARVEHWENDNGTFDEEPVVQEEEWCSDQYFDQGRAAAFDDLVTLCEGEEGEPVVKMLLAPLPHPLFRMQAHPWHNGYSFWSPWQNSDLPKSSMNGFCVNEEMSAWDFFKADPRAPMDDPRSMLFDKQANFFRYLIARWGYSPAVGAWVVLDEIEGIGDEEAYFPDRTGFWKHPECQRWLDDVVRLFHGRLRRSCDVRGYDGDPYAHPVSSACSSVQGAFARGDNLDWTWGDPDAKLDLAGWHFYPPSDGWEGNWSYAWQSVIQGTQSFSTAPLGDRPRLITEFGAPERWNPADEVSGYYPGIFHFGAWSSIMSGQAGTVMDWNDGKEFGEFHWKGEGTFSKARYPISQITTISTLRDFLKDASPEEVSPVGRASSKVSFSAASGVVPMGLYGTGGVWGWVYLPDAVENKELLVTGLDMGSYVVSLVDPWTGKTVMTQTVRVDGPLAINLAMGLPRPTVKRRFPEYTRLWKGRDVAFKVTRKSNP